MNRIVFGSAGALALLLSAASVNAAPATRIQPAFQTNPDLVRVQLNGIDARPSSELPNRELRDRIELLRRAVRNNIPGADAMLRADRQELMGRQNGTQSPPQQPVAEQPAPEQPVAEEPRKRDRKRKEQPVAEQPVVEQPVVEQPAPQQPVAEEPRRRDRQRAEQPAEQPVVEQPVAEQPRKRDTKRRDAAQEPQLREPIPANPRNTDRAGSDPRLRTFLSDGRPAGQLNDAQLRERIDLARELVQTAGPRQANRIQQVLDADAGELANRIKATTGVDTRQVDANREARRILSDGRDARSLNENDLRQRMQSVRGVLAQGGLAPRFENELRSMLNGDRTELRSRVASREDRRQRDGANSNNRRDQARGNDQGIGRNREALRRELLDARAERQRRLQNRQNVIVIDRRARYTPLPAIALAEAYDEDVERQLVAPPSRPIERRYSLREYRQTPSLRTLMPGIEVDTVKFGFNEDFVREQEIGKLDRIGEILERIIAGNPDEVFLIEGHTDLVGSAAYNEALSLRRAAAIRDALTTYFYIPEKNLEIAGYGEEYPRIPTEFEEPENRRVTIRRITPILYGSR
ncbi:MAG: OmpA family protein [Nitratireductor sp.]